MGTNLGDLLRGMGLKASEPAPEADPLPVADLPVSTAGRVIVRSLRKGHGGKTVTTLTGLPAPLEPFAKRLRVELGVGARVDGELVVVQGDQTERVLRWLLEQGFERAVRG